MNNQPKRRLKINLMDLEGAFEYRDPAFGILHFLDLETGEVEMTTDEERRQLEEIAETHADPDTGAIDWPAVLPQLDLPDWQKERLVQVDQVERGFGTRSIAIPEVGSHEGYDDMVAFIETVSNPRLQGKLELAIEGRGAFRSFKNVLLDHPQERERWFEFSQQRMHQRVLDWLESEGIEAV